MVNFKPTMASLRIGGCVVVPCSQPSDSPSHSTWFEASNGERHHYYVFRSGQVTQLTPDSSQTLPRSGFLQSTVAELIDPLLYERTVRRVGRSFEIEFKVVHGLPSIA